MSTTSRAQALFLHEVAHPGVAFVDRSAEGEFRMVCDRRQLGQALTNVVKNAVEAIETRRNRGEHSLAGDRVDLRDPPRGRDQLVIDVTDTGIGLPEDRERLTEPYMTTRVRGTGLGLAIVKKIVEEHMGEIAFLDRPGGRNPRPHRLRRRPARALATTSRRPLGPAGVEDDDANMTRRIS
jgi:two-component system nitrogen regulation sensor histidine kinase NtrY